MNVVLLLTACVNPGNMCFTALKDCNERLTQYVRAIDYYMYSNSYKLVVVENTGYNLKKEFPNFPQDRIEFLSFLGTQDYSLGKGFGEGEILRYAFCHSSFLKEDSVDFILKITGRYIICNLENEIKLISLLPHSLIRNGNMVVAITNDKEKTAVSYAFVANEQFYNNSTFLQDLTKCNDSENICFEHILYDSINKMGGDSIFVSFPLDIHVDAILGSTGTRFWTPTWRSHFHQLRIFIPQLILIWIKYTFKRL